MPGTYQSQVRNVAIAVEVLDALKTESGCTDCGYNRSPAALHFDHVDPEAKRVELGWREDRSKLTSKIKLRRYLEHVERYCEIRCANCHAERSVREKHWAIRRGKGASVMLPDLGEPLF